MTVNKSEPTANAPTGLTATYGQTLADVSLEGKNPEGNTEGTWAWDDGAQCVGDVVSPAATFPATFTPSDAAKYNTVSVPVAVTVNKAESSVTQAPTAKSPIRYSGEPQALVETGTAEGGEMQYSLDGKAYSKEVPTGTDVGRYIIWYKVVGDANHKDVKAQSLSSLIDKAASSVTQAPKPTNPTYTGRAQALVTAGKASGGAMRYSLDGKGWSAKVPTATDAGTYTVRYKAAGDASHTDSAAKSVKSTIAKARLTSIAKVADQAFADRAVTPRPAVKSGSKALKAGTDFRYSYKNNA